MFWTQKLAWAIACLLILLTAFAITCAATGWSHWVETLAHFQIQYWLGAVFLTLLLLPLQARYPILIGLFCTALLSTQVLTWYIPANSQTTPFTKVLFSNVWSQNQNYGQVLTLVRAEDPDFAVFAEVSAKWKQQLDTLKDILPYATRDQKGEIIYSKVDLTGTEIIDRDPRFLNALIIRKLKYKNREFTLVADHPPSPRNNAAFVSRNQQLAALGQYLENLPDTLIVLGDFNISLWSPYYRQFVDRTRLINARQGFGLAPSWALPTVRRMPEWIQPWLSVPIDHIFTRSGSFKIRATSFHTGPYVGSDHLPVIAEIGMVKP